MNAGLSARGVKLSRATIFTLFSNWLKLNKAAFVSPRKVGFVMTRTGRNSLQTSARTLPIGGSMKSRTILSATLRRVFFVAQLALFFTTSMFAPAGFSASGDRAAQPARAGQSSSQNSQSVADQSTDRQPEGLQSGKMQARPLQITYEDGKLTIEADNVPLSEILSQVRKILGADVVIPAGVADQRMWVQFGPGPARRILRDLLDITDLDYVMQASDKDEDGVLSVALTARSKSLEPGLPASSTLAAGKRHPQPVASNPVEYSEPETQAVSESVVVSEPIAPVSSLTPAETRAAAAASLQPSRDAAGPVSTAPLIGSAEQMAQQLQNLYQRRRQLQVQQNQSPPATN